jgi:hypothetical protein
MSSISRFEVLPLQAQIDIRDPAATEYPQWETGDETAVATAQAIAVATQGDVDGRVAVEVVADDEFRVEDSWREVFDGELLTTGDDVVIGNYLAGEVHPVRLGAGWHRVRVATNPADAPATSVRIAFGKAET